MAIQAEELSFGKRLNDRSTWKAPVATSEQCRSGLGRFKPVKHTRFGGQLPALSQWALHLPAAPAERPIFHRRDVIADTAPR